MTMRESLSVAIVLRDVVEPCLARLVRAGELDALQLEWRTIRRPDMSDHVFRETGPGLHVMPRPPKMIDELRLVLTLEFGDDEKFRFDIAAGDYFPSAFEGDLSLVRDALFSSLQDFIAESGFGWGQLRE
jgi:hypothetical protein